MIVKRIADHGLGLFPDFPSPDIVREFLEFNAETGKPHEWPFLSRSQPPRNATFEIVEEFIIPDKFKYIVEMVPCPICSPDSGKFKIGRLAWFPEEGCLRAIGHKCAERYFGREVTEAAVQRFIEKRQRKHAEEFLLQNLDTARTIKSYLQDIAPLAPKIDNFIQALRKRGPSQRWADVARMAVDGQLVVKRLEEVHETDAFGKESTKKREQTVASFRVRGISCMKSGKSLTALARNAENAVIELDGWNEENADKFIEQSLDTLEHIHQAEKLMRYAIDTRAKLEFELATFKEFMQSENLMQLAEWTNHPNSGSPFRIQFSLARPGAISIRQSDHMWKHLEIDTSILKALPNCKR